MTMIGRTKERIALGVAALVALTGVLPITQDEDRAGVLWTALLLAVITLIWFHAVPPRAFGDRRVVVFGLFVQPVLIVLLSLTGGNLSPYFPYFLLPVLATIFSPRADHTLLLGAVSAASLLVVALITPRDDPSAAQHLVSRLIELAAYVLFTWFAGRALRDARRAVTARAEEPAAERTTVDTRPP